MNKTWRSVWNEADQAWVAAPETARARGKATRGHVLLGTTALGVVAALGSGSSFAAGAVPGVGSLELCNGVGGASIGSGGTINRLLDCSGGKPGGDGLAFSLNNTGDPATGGYGFDASTARVSAYKNGKLVLLGSSVLVQGPTTFTNTVTMSNQKIVALAPGALSATSTDAVNGSQLYATNQSITNIEGGIANAVQYDSSAHDSVTLGGKGAARPVGLHNVAAGTAPTDALNVSQLQAAGANFDANGTITNPFVSYDDASKGIVTLGGAGGTKITNVKPGALSATSTDAVNGSQLYATNQSITNIAGGVADAVQYDSSAHDSVTLGGKGAAKPVGLHNVAAGTAPTDALNVSQLQAAGANFDANGTITNPFVSYDDANKGIVTLGGAGGTKITNVKPGALSATSTDAVNGAQLNAVNQQVTENTTNLTELTNNINLGTIGLVRQDGASRKLTVGATTDGTLVDFTGTAGARRLTGIAAGTGAADAANVGQIQSAGFVLDMSGAVTNQAVTYNAGSIASGKPTIALAPGSGFSKYYVDGDRAKAMLPAGTVISNVAAGIQQTDAVNVGQVFDIVSNLTGGGLLPQNNNTNNKLFSLAAAPGNSGVNTSNLTRSYATAAYYSQVNGLGNSTGSTPPSDMARVGTAAGAVAVGSNALTTGAGGVALGVQAYAQQNDSVAIGSGSVATAADTVSVGNDGTASLPIMNPDGTSSSVTNAANTRRIVNMAAGQGSTDAVNVAQLNGALGVIGGGAKVNTDGTIVMPSFSVGGTTVNTVNAAIANLDQRVKQNTTDIASLQGGGSGGGGGSSGVANPDALNYDSSAHDKVTLASTTGGLATMTGLQNATLSAGSTDAVTGQQLYTTNQNLANTNIEIANLSQTIQNVSAGATPSLSSNTANGPAAASGTSTIAVGGGATASGNNSTALGDKARATATNAVALGANAVAKNAGSVAIGANSVADRDNSVSVGAAGAERQITNVAAGTANTDAVNLQQLNDKIAQQNSTVSQQVAGVQQQISSVQRQVDTVAKNAYAGVAAAMAMPNLTPSGPGRTLVAAGGGYYMGGSAAAVGVTYRSANSHWLVNGAVSVTNTGNAGARAQVGYEF